MDRKEAIKVVMENYPHVGFSGSQFETALRTLIPELAESEDERALRIIKKRMCYDPVPISDEDRRIVEAWLEKQKEPQNKSMAHEDSSWSGILTSPLCKDKNLDDIAQEYVEGVKEYNPTPDWNLIHTAVCYGYHLADQKEQKPSEWSEEDERRINAVIELLENTSAIHPNYSHRKLIIWLKSLRPTWKPSEEQMSMLLAVIRDPNNAGSESCFLAFKSLYEDLKKL